MHPQGAYPTQVTTCITIRTFNSVQMVNLCLYPFKLQLILDYTPSNNNQSIQTGDISDAFLCRHSHTIYSWYVYKSNYLHLHAVIKISPVAMLCNYNGYFLLLYSVIIYATHPWLPCLVFRRWSFIVPLGRRKCNHDSGDKHLWWP